MDSVGPAQPCERCGGTRFEEEDGQWRCWECGLTQGTFVTGEDDGDYGKHGQTVRRKEIKQRQSRSRILRGPKAYQLYLQAWQFILWKQCHILVHQKGLPPELWDIVRDLWTLWLAKLEHRLRDTPEDGGDLTDPEPKVDVSSGIDSETDADVDGEADKDMNASADKAIPTNSPTLVDLVALNYMGILMLRRPIGLATILRWIMEEDIPYIRAVRHVPLEMRERMPGEYRIALDTNHVLREDELQLGVYRRAKWYNDRFGMVVPPLNDALFLLGYVRRLALPVEVYGVARRLNALVGHRFRHPDAPASRRRPATAYPESQLMSLVVVATKLLFPFDSDEVRRYPFANNDPASLRMDWSAWLDAKVEFDAAPDPAEDDGRLPPGREIFVTDRDVLEMTGPQLDRYMDWYQRTWTVPQTGASTHPRGSWQVPPSTTTVDRDILDLFPLAELPRPVRSREEDALLETVEQSRLTDRIRRVQASLSSQRAVSPQEEADRDLQGLLRPGQRYPLYRSPESLQHLPVVKAFHEEAAHTACLAVKTLLLAVRRTEEKIERWIKDKRREQMEGVEDTEEDGSESGSKRPSDPMEDDDVPPATSPPAKLARELGGLDIGPSPDDGGDQDRDDDGLGVDVDMDGVMEMLPEL